MIVDFEGLKCYAQMLKKVNYVAIT